MTAQHKCQGRVNGGWHSHECGKNAKFEHEGKFYCGTHHPPNIYAKRAAQSAKWDAEWKAKAIARDAATKERQEKDRRAELYPELLGALNAVLAEHEDGYGLRCVDQVRAAIAKAGA